MVKRLGDLIYVFIKKNCFAIKNNSRIIRLVEYLFHNCCSKLDEHTNKKDEWNKKPVSTTL